ncbi:MAG: ferritin-like domain-containing protein [Solirubrobacteraceae bacterium]
MSEDDGPSRRALLGAATTALGSGAAVLAGCGGGGRTAAKAVHKAKPTVQHADIALLKALLDLERRTVAAYIAGLPLLSLPDARIAKQFLNEELQHTGELISLIKAAGGKTAPHLGAYDLGRPGDGPAVLALLHGLERAQISAYLETIPKLSPSPVRAAAATILASDAQHVAVLRAVQGLDPMPSAFLTGQQ